MMLMENWLRATLETDNVLMRLTSCDGTVSAPLVSSGASSMLVAFAGRSSAGLESPPPLAPLADWVSGFCWLVSGAACGVAAGAAAGMGFGLV